MKSTSFHTGAAIERQLRSSLDTPRRSLHAVDRQIVKLADNRLAWVNDDSCLVGVKNLAQIGE